jgi:hypothetical protein
MNYRGRINSLEKALRRAADAPEPVTLRFIYGGSPEEKKAIERGEKILRFDYSRGERG